MISLILPYWNRPEAAKRALDLLSNTYRGYDMEVVIVDDGSTEPLRADFPDLRIKLVTLPLKDGPKCPATAWNAGVAAASSDIICLSCVEILHTEPVLQEMERQVREIGERGYVLAAAWCPEYGWHCHSTVSVPQCPPGVGIAFCGMMHKSLFAKAGGFDEAYRDGAGYEDRDFIHRLLRVGAKFVIRDDLKVIHPKDGATIAWGGEKFERNQRIFESKWINASDLNKPAVTFCCLQAGNYCGRGSEYVNNLFDMVWRNTSLPFRFVCLTDDPTGLEPAIQVMELPSDLERWYGKLYFFKRGLFQDGERVIFLDLDTVIVGSLDEIAKYDGQFATLTDFYSPERVGPAVMMWKAGDYSASIWEEWVSEGKPRNDMGDLWWLNNLDQGRFANRCDRLQKLFPGVFVSYKGNCRQGLPEGAKVVCFHGHPRPHEVTDEWVSAAWKVGGATAKDLKVVSNTAKAKVAENIKSACKRDIPWLEMAKPHDGQISIVAGGPSLPGFVGEIRESGRPTIAVNGAHGYLLGHGISAAYHLIIDARPENASFITAPAKSYLLASQCDKSVFDAAKGPTTLVHMHTEGVLDSIPQTIKPINLISSGSTVGLAAIAIAYCMGYRKIFVYGMDSSYESDHHAYPQPSNDADRVMEVEAGGRKFKAAPWMVAQAQQFQTLAEELANDGCELHIRCHGLLGHVAWLMSLREAA